MFVGRNGNYFQKLTSGAMLLAVAPTLTLQAQNAKVNKQTIKAMNLILGKILKIFIGAVWFTAIVLLYKPFFAKAFTAIVFLYKSFFAKSKNINASNKFIKINENKYNADEKDLKKIEKEKDISNGKGTKKTDVDEKNNEKPISFNEELSKSKRKVEQPEKSQSKIEKEVDELFHYHLNLDGNFFSVYNKEISIVLKVLDEAIFILENEAKIIDFSNKIESIEKNIQENKSKIDIIGSKVSNFIKEKMNLGDDPENKKLKKVVKGILNGKVVQIDKVKPEEFESLKGEISEYSKLSKIGKELKKSKEKLRGDFEKVKDYKEKDIAEARKKFFELKKEYIELVTGKDSKTDYYVPYVPSFLDVDGNVSNEKIVEKFKNWVGIAKKSDDYKQNHLFKKWVDKLCLDCILCSGVDNSVFKRLFWLICLNDDKFCVAREKKKNEVVSAKMKEAKGSVSSSNEMIMVDNP